MSSNKNFDTIAAICTPIGIGGLSVIRISGPNSIDLVSQCFVPPDSIISSPSHTAHYGMFRGLAGNEIDEVVALVFRHPGSYTGEDTVEISCHGGMFVTQKILTTLIERGVRYAEPGEFTKRAFINGKMDLAQAEAVADVIHAGSDRALAVSLHQLEGNLSKQILSCRNKLIDILALLELELDFAEEGYDLIDKSNAISVTKSIILEIEALSSTYTHGRLYRDGIKTVIAGAPNVGKSSLLNTLLGSHRAIVTHVAGTTRDTIEENVIINGVLFRIIDTAGIREADNIVEEEGIRRSRKELETSDLILLVLDSSRNPSHEDSELFNYISSLATKNSLAFLILFNKTDLTVEYIDNYFDMLHIGGKTDPISISAKTGAGVTLLKDKMADITMSGTKSIQEGSTTITNLRHFSTLSQAKRSLSLAIASLESGLSGELAAIDMRAGLDALGEIVGAVTTDDILDSIFSKFCIGK
jgi:tRNA modification GTPase